MANEDLVSVRQRLENLKKNPIYVPMPLDNIVPDKEAKPIGGGELTFGKLLQQKIDKVIKKIELIKEKMKTSDTFMNHFYDLKNTEKEFLELLAKAEEKHVTFPSTFAKKIDEIKGNIRSKIR